MGVAHEYAKDIMWRSRVPMEPVDFVPNWADRPRKNKFYPGTETFPLPQSPAEAAQADIAAGCLPGPGQAADGAAFTLPLLAGMLQDSYGLVDRRLGVQANTDLAGLPHATHANFSRGTASGGGLYPVSVYWAAGPSGPLTPGLYHYSPSQHAVNRLLTGEVTGEVRAALGEGAEGADTDQFLILGIKYWQNAFKYNNFSFHVVSMDLGTVVQTWRMWARPLGLRIAPALWFDEERLSRLLGVDRPENPADEAEEGIFAVVPLSWEGSRPPGPAPSPAPVVRHRDVTASRTLLSFDTLQKVHRATAEHATERPAPGTLASAAGALPVRGEGQLALPAPELPKASVSEVLRRRRSSFGRFDARRPLTAVQLASTLAACAATSLGSDAEEPGGTALTRLYAFVNHVEGLKPGAYAYDPEAHALRLVTPGSSGAFLQRNYFLSNYNLEQAGAVLVPTVRTTAVLDAVGDRGYRLVAGTVGAVSQTFYTAASALGLGAGVALGFDNISYVEELGLQDGDEAPLLIMLLGNERPRPAEFRHEIA
ncbi:SagB family peptide dehydrogenase [Streptomyces physcomitrii]|uniref:SagB/ThcOx family dehydrogenase n=1 Tax=Streptomyces physcomitrii TaxID=2724184 RepID=A0ABX1HAK7_9ACTN|nr:SagB family peptide dehydrogenase [Streptomyces physcomitrii]NKI44295.1 SagB/ThcOx family dehydrogenase [Streptomyces physcomitrii]